MHLCRALLDAGHAVFGLDNLNSYYDIQLKHDRLKTLESDKKFEFLKMDLTDGTGLKSLFKKYEFEMVFNLAAQAGVRYSLTNPQEYIDSNVQGFFNILEACRATPPRHLVYASSSSVYGLAQETPLTETMNTDNPISLYAASKKANEVIAASYAHLFKIPMTGLRFFTVYGPWGRPDMAPFLFTDALFREKPIKLFNSGNLRRDFTYISDIMQGILASSHVPPNSSENHHTVLNIGCSDPINVSKFLSILENLTGKKAIVENVPMQPGDVIETYASVKKIQARCNFSPEVRLEEGLKEFVSWYRQRYI